MKDLKQTSFADRQTAAAEARKAMLAKFKPKPTVTAPEGVVDRAAQREAIKERKQREKAEALARRQAQFAALRGR